MATVRPGANEVQVVNERRVRVVPERHVRERDPAPTGRAGRADRVGRLLGGVEELEHALGRGEADWNTLLIEASSVIGMRKLAGVLDERLDVAERHRPRWPRGGRR